MSKKIINLFLFLLLFIKTVLGYSAGTEEYQTLLQKGWQERQNKNYNSAVMFYQKAIALNNLAVDGHVGLLWSYIEKKDFISAEELVDKLIVQFIDNIWIRKGAAWTYYNRERYADAVKNYRYVLNESGEDREMRIGLVIALFKQGDIGQARKEYEKLDHEGKNDIRVAGIYQKSGWIFKPQFYSTYKKLVDPVDRSYILALNLGAEILHTSGIGFYIDLSLFLSDMPKQSTSKRSNLSMEFLPGASIFYAQDKYLLWTRYSLLAGSKNENAGHAVNLYGNYHFSRFFIAGLGFDIGLYDGYKTVQFTPEIGFKINQKFFIKAVPMLQRNWGSKIGSLTLEKTRFSFELDFELSLKAVKLNISGYYGLRWFTSENRALLIWNSDEELNWGLKVKALFFPNNKFNIYASFRLDNAIRQKGLENSTIIFSATVGIIFTF